MLVRSTLTLLVGMQLSATTAVPIADGSWAWPVHGPVIHDFEPPETPFARGTAGSTSPPRWERW